MLCCFLELLGIAGTDHLHVLLETQLEFKVALVGC